MAKSRTPRTAARKAAGKRKAARKAARARKTARKAGQEGRQATARRAPSPLAGRADEGAAEGGEEVERSKGGQKGGEIAKRVKDSREARGHEEDDAPSDKFAPPKRHAAAAVSAAPTPADAPKAARPRPLSRSANLRWIANAVASPRHRCRRRCLHHSTSISAPRRHGPAAGRSRSTSANTTRPAPILTAGDVDANWEARTALATRRRAATIRRLIRMSWTKSAARSALNTTTTRS